MKSNGQSFKINHGHYLSVRDDNTNINNNPDVEEVDVIVIGSGFGGLSCAAMSAKYGMNTICVEAHDTAGGVAHSFSRYSKIDHKVPFQFDSGPSLISGLSSKSTNPLRQVLDAIGTADDVEWYNYNGWMVHDYADGKSFKLTTGDDGTFEKAIEEKAGREAREEFERFRDIMLTSGGLTEVSGYIPPLALRGDLFVARSMLGYLLKFLTIGTKGLLLTGPFTLTMEKYGLTHPFLIKWFDYLAFALSGLDAAHTQAAPVSYTMGDLHRKGRILDYPKGGMDSLIEALVKGLVNHGGELRLNSRVERLILLEENGKVCCKGVILSDGKIIKATKGVVCNAPLWNMARIVSDSLLPDDKASSSSSSSSSSSILHAAVAKIKKQADEMEMTGSFMHLHLGIPKEGIPTDIEMHHSMLNFDVDVEEEQNLVIISIPTVADSSLAPEGYHIIHAYTAASENFKDWESFLEQNKDSGKVGASPNSSKARNYSNQEGYEQLKTKKAEALWKAVEFIIPDVRERAAAEGSICIVGTPLTHRRYNQRFRGTYGPAPSPGKNVWELPGCTTPIQGLLTCGDTCFPGIGLPGVAASGTIAANTLVDVSTQLELMRSLKSNGALQ
eukprot:CAMPEP_0176502422 /NCGR_PEP_ID=MMETSP0200_2-20121128/14744_1 /TAXON_ID=947934 /ORGANISM="Chaetoceros sp., Strain GSL56" /LENGTH=613 /DNA_ID=CAMNT_0017901491 /DNA_START=237 /DNA_END=2078 /DNA_ORIENTATION=-